MVRGKKIEDPIKEGQSSKLYLAAWERPLTGYRLASKIFGTKTYYEKKVDGSREEKEEVRRPSKPYQLASDYPELFERPEMDGKKKILSRVEPFLERLEKEMEENGTTLTQPQRETLKEYLDGPFRRALVPDYMNVDYSKPVNAYAELLAQLKVVLSFEHSARTVRRSLGSQKVAGVNLKEKAKEKFREGAEQAKGDYPWEKEITEDLTGFSEELMEKLISDTRLRGASGTLNKVQQLTNSLLIWLLEHGGVSGLAKDVAMELESERSQGSESSD